MEHLDKVSNPSPERRIERLCDQIWNLFQYFRINHPDAYALLDGRDVEQRFSMPHLIAHANENVLQKIDAVLNEIEVITADVPGELYPQKRQELLLKKQKEFQEILATLSE